MIAVIASLCGMQVFSKSWKMRHIAVCLISECQGKWKDAELSKGEEGATGFRHTLLFCQGDNQMEIPNNF